MSNTSASANRESSRIAGGNGSAGKAFAAINLDEKDTGKAIERQTEPELPPTEDAGGGDSSPKSSDSREWRRRIARIQRSFSQKFADQEAERQREMRDMQSRIDALQTDRSSSGDDGEDAAHESRMDDLRQKLEDALEKGESKLAAELQVKISRAEAEFWAKKRARSGSQTSNRQPEKNRERERAEPEREGRGPTQMGRRWIDANVDWWEDPEFEIERNAAIAIDNRLLQDGSDPDSEKHYRKIIKRLKSKFPKLEVAMPDDDDDDDDDEDDEDEDGDRRMRSARRRRPPVPGFNDRGQEAEPRRQTSGKGRRIVLSNEDRKNMLRFRLDPESDDDIRAYAESIEETRQAYEGDR